MDLLGSGDKERTREPVADSLQSLTESEALFRAAFEQAVVGMALRTLGTREPRWLRVNQYLCDMLGYTQEEFLNMPPVEINPPEDRAEAIARTQMLERGDVGNQVREKRYLHKNGSIVHVSVSRTVLRDKDGRPTCTLSVVRDITYRVHTEVQLRVVAGVFAHAVEGIVIADRAKNVILVNPAFTRMTGYEAEEVVGKPVRALAKGWRTPELHDDVWKVVAQAGVWEGDIWDWKKGREPYCAHLSVSVIPDNEGKPNQYCMIFMHITAHKIAEGKLLQLNAELEKRVAQRTADLGLVNQELEAFSFSVSHDLRAPLRAVRGFGKLLRGALDKEEPDEEAVFAYLQKIEDGAERMENLIRDLLDLSSLSRQDLHRKAMDVSAAAESELSQLRDAHRERRVACSVMPGMTADADPGLLRIVLQNLVGNAWKFTAGAESARIDIGCERINGEDVFFVRDNGAGFDMRYAAKLFAPFQRLHRRDEFEGSGIGLSIVQRIVSRHGGRVWAQAQLGAGATFFFTVGSSAEAVDAEKKM